MTKPERRTLDEKIEQLHARGCGTHDELFHELARLLTAMVDNQQRLEKRVLRLEERLNRHG